MTFFKNKKGGGLSEGIYILVVMAVLALILSVSIYIQDIFEPIMDEELTDATANATYQSIESRNPTAMDSLFIICFVLLWAGAIILAFFVDTHPIWFVLSIVGLIVVLLAAAMFSNIYVELNDSLVSDGMTSSLPMLGYVMKHLVEFVLAITFSIFISLFAKSRQ